MTLLCNKLKLSDVIYIGSVNRDHFEIGMMMINHSKNVLMEKPMCLNKAQSTQLTKAAKDKKVFLMEVEKN